MGQKIPLPSWSAGGRRTEGSAPIPQWVKVTLQTGVLHAACNAGNNHSKLMVVRDRIKQNRHYLSFF
jgi:hypothetical protein